MLIRKANIQDIDSCVMLLRMPEFAFASGEYPDHDYLIEYVNAGLFYVAVVDNDIVGCIYGEFLKSNTALLWYALVREDYRGRGIGTLLVSRFEEECNKKGIKWIVLYAPQNSINTIEFYEELGYNKGNAYYEFNKRIL